MPADMSHAGLAPELFWLAAAAALTGLLWIPYILMRLVEHGPWPALKRLPADNPPKTEMGLRLQAAHINAVENLPLFAVFVLVAVLSQRTGALTAAAAATYFWARLAHYLIYVAGIPVLRTLSFAVGWGACAVIALHVFGLA